jgi:hypothetical protein
MSRHSLSSVGFSRLLMTVISSKKRVSELVTFPSLVAVAREQPSLDARASDMRDKDKDRKGWREAPSPPKRSSKSQIPGPNEDHGMMCHTSTVCNSKVCSSGYHIQSSAHKYTTSHICRQIYQKNKKRPTQRQSSKTLEEECFPVSESF